MHFDQNIPSLKEERITERKNGKKSDEMGLF